MQDDQISVASTLEMYNELGTPENLKRKIAFADVGNHAIGSYITSKDYENVEAETEQFLSEVVEK